MFDGVIKACTARSVELAYVEAKSIDSEQLKDFVNHTNSSMNV